MVKDYLLGLMDENTLDSISMIKKKVKVCLNGQMEENMKDNGSPGNKTGSVFIQSLMESQKLVNGRRVNALLGFEFQIIITISPISLPF